MTNIRISFEIKPYFGILIAALFCIACSGAHSYDVQDDEGAVSPSSIKEISLPEGYVRMHDDNDKFGKFLGNQGLKPQGTAARTYKREVSEFDDLTYAVLRTPVNGDPYIQCADAIILLRSEFLWKIGAKKQISFHFTNGFEFPYSKWADGARPEASGDNFSWREGAVAPDPSYGSFMAYLHVLYTFAGTKSLVDDMLQVRSGKIEVGDVLDVPGTPGHAVIVADVAVHKRTGRQIVLLVQGNTPAQDLVVLKNKRSSDLSPWFEVRHGVVKTEKWNFDLKRHHFRF